MATPGVSTAEMDEAVAAIFREHDAIPLFLGYPSSVKGKPAFPAAICAAPASTSTWYTASPTVARCARVISCRSIPAAKWPAGAVTRR